MKLGGSFTLGYFERIKCWHDHSELSVNGWFFFFHRVVAGTKIDIREVVKNSHSYSLRFKFFLWYLHFLRDGMLHKSSNWVLNLTSIL